jgi:hypothetical protein
VLAKSLGLFAYIRDACGVKASDKTFNSVLQARSQNCERPLTTPCLSVCLSLLPCADPHGTTRLPPDGFSRNFKCLSFFEHTRMSRKFKFNWTTTRITAPFHEYQYTFFNISSSIILRMTNISDKSFRENKETHFMFSNFFSKFVIYETMWGKLVEFTCHRGQYVAAHCMLNTYGNKYTLTICNTYCFSNAAIDTRKHLNVKL